MNQKIKDGKGLHPNEVKNLSSLGSQLVLINVINVIAGATAGIGASLFVDGARFRWPSTGLAVGLIAVALAVTEITGIFVIRYTTRPTRAWIYDTSIFRSYLARINASGLVSDEDLDDIVKTQAEWASRTIVRPLRSRKELQELGLELMSAHQEWASQKPTKPAEFGNRLLAETSREQVWRWIRRKRLWRLGIPPIGSSFTLAALTIVVLVPYSHGRFFGIVLLTILFLFWSTVLFCASYFTARRDLVMTNRYVALEKKQLNDCDQLIERIKELHKVQDDKSLSNDHDLSTLVIRICRWDLRRRPRHS